MVKGALVFNSIPVSPVTPFNIIEAVLLFGGIITIMPAVVGTVIELNPFERFTVCCENVAFAFVLPICEE